ARTKCQNNLKQIGLAFHNYHDTNRFFPPARIGRGEYPTWAVLILPYLEQNQVYDKWLLSPVKRFNLQPQQAREALISTYFCPARRGPMLTVGDPSDSPAVPAVPGCAGDYACSSGIGS